MEKKKEKKGFLLFSVKNKTVKWLKPETLWQKYWESYLTNHESLTCHLLNIKETTFCRVSEHPTGLTEGFILLKDFFKCI